MFCSTTTMVWPASASRAAGRQQVLHDDRRQALERLVEQHSLGSRISARAIASICCSPPDRSVPRLVAALLEPREHLVDALERPALGRGQAGQHQVLLDVEAAEDAAVLVDQLHAGPGDRVALLAGDVLAVEHDLAGARRHHAHQALERRALAGAVAAEQRHHLVALDAAARRRTGCANRRSRSSGPRPRAGSCVHPAEIGLAHRRDRS